MKIVFYPKLAVTGIRKNGKIYFPYILTCIGMVMIFYIVAFLSADESLLKIPGADDMKRILRFGVAVIGFFAVLFLFYTNSFLMRRRKKEFGLYNVLGLDKYNLARILLWENIIIGGGTIILGLLSGILFSRLAQLIMIRLLHSKSNGSFLLIAEPIVMTCGFFCIIFLLVFLYGVVQIKTANPVELLRSEQTGEKPPKANWLLAAAGLLLLVAAYIKTLQIEQPLEALMWFFWAVVAVIIATYLLFVAGSVVLCRLLQKWKSYYYHPRHFVSVSTMAFRMKRNGAGLASICILSTMLLVVLSTTTCLYLGAEDIIRNRYPRNIGLDLNSFHEDTTKEMIQLVDKVLQQKGEKAENVQYYRYLGFAGCQSDGKIELDSEKLENFSNDFAEVCELYVFPLEDYNRITNSHETLEQDEILLYTPKMEYRKDTLVLQDYKTFRIKKHLEEFMQINIDSFSAVSSFYLIVPDIDTIEEICRLQKKAYGESASLPDSYYGFDLNCSDAVQRSIVERIEKKLPKLEIKKQQAGEPIDISVSSSAGEKSSFYGLYNGLFFIGIVLGIVFLFGTVLIIYYKQITEGYEDQSRFQILQKVGMTSRQIRHSVNSQILIVFFLPLVMAGLHILVAFQIIIRLLQLFGMSNVSLFGLTTIVCFIIFAAFYVLVYLATARIYYRIIRSGQ